MRVHWDVSNCLFITQEKFHGHLATWNAWKCISGYVFKQKWNLERAPVLWNLRETSRVYVLAQPSGAHPSPAAAFCFVNLPATEPHQSLDISSQSLEQCPAYPGFITDSQCPRQVKPPPPASLHSSTACDCVVNRRSAALCLTHK